MKELKHREVKLPRVTQLNVRGRSRLQGQAGRLAESVLVTATLFHF